MAKIYGKKPADGGFELDRINLTSFVSGNSRKPAENAGQAPAPENAPRRDRQSHMSLVTFLAILALLMAFTALFKKQEFTFNLPSETSRSGTHLENYLRVGPVTATLANEDIVKFSIEIDCGNAEMKERLAGKDTQIRDQIVSILTEPGTEELIAKRDFKAVKAKIKERIGSIGTVPVEEIYFSELLLY